MGNEIHLDKNVAVANKDENEANYCGAKNHKADEDEVINMRCEEAKGIVKAAEYIRSGMFSFKSRFSVKNTGDTFISDILLVREIILSMKTLF